jgi:hypothetical protein
MAIHRAIMFYPLLFGVLLMSGCDQITGAADVARIQAEAKATGGACRHAGRGPEDCYALNPNASRAAIFAGWKEMNDYMRENKIDEVKPQLPPPPAQAAEDASH